MCLFKTYCISFYGVAVWMHYSVTVMKKLQAAYNKCVKLFFGYERRHSLAAAFYDLKLPTLATVLHNVRHNFAKTISCHTNAVVRYVHQVCNMDLVF